MRVNAKTSAIVLTIAVLSGCSTSPEARRDKFLSRGKAFTEKQEFSRALLEFKNAAKVAPNDPEVYYQMGNAFMLLRDANSAYIAFRKAVELNPGRVDAQLKLAQLQTTSSDPEVIKDAENRLKELLQKGSSTSDMLAALAFAELKLGNTQGAVENFEQALAQAPTELFSVVMLTNAKLSLRDVKGAQAVLERAVTDAPKSADARKLLGDFFVAQRKPVEAEAAYGQALTVDPNHGPTLVQLARIKLSQGRKEDAEQLYKKVSALQGYKSIYAIYLYEQGRGEAVAEFERLFRENPSDRQMRTNLIIAYRSTNHAAEAEKILAQALKKNGKDGEALLQRAEIAIGNSQYTQAELDLNQLAKLRPNGPEVHYVLARLNLARGKELPYRQELAEALRLNPDLLTVRVELAQNYIKAKEYAAAVDLLDHAPAVQRSAVPLLITRNWALWGAGNLAEMRTGIDRGLSLVKSPELMVQDGFWKLRAGNPNAARSSLEEALHLNPNDLRALQGVRLSYLAEKNAGMALRKAREFAAEHPKSAIVQQFLGELLQGAGMKQEARAAFEAAKTADPTFSAAQMSLAQVDVQEGKLDDARKRIEVLNRKDPSNKTTELWLAEIELLRNDKDLAIKHFREAVSSGSGNAEAYNNLAYLLTDQHPDEAVSYAQKAVEMVPDRPAYCDTLGWALYRKGLFSAAVPYLQRAAASKGEAVWSYHLAMAYAKAGDLASGRRTLQAALKLNPNAPEAKAAMEIIGQN